MQAGFHPINKDASQILSTCVFAFCQLYLNFAYEYNFYLFHIIARIADVSGRNDSLDGNAA